MPTEGEVLFNAGYQYAFVRFMESESPTHFEARPFNPAVRLTADPFRESERWDEQIQGRYGFSTKETNGDKVGERLGPFNLQDPNPLWKAWCEAHGVPMTEEGFMDTLYVAKRQKMTDGEEYGTAWDLWISKTVVAGDPRPPSDLESAYGKLLAENESLRRQISKLEADLAADDRADESEKDQVAALLKAQTTDIRAALAKVTIKKQGGGVPMAALREIKAVVG